jgi:hypothetical protein
LHPSPDLDYYHNHLGGDHAHIQRSLDPKLSQGVKAVDTQELCDR